MNTHHEQGRSSVTSVTLFSLCCKAMNTFPTSRKASNSFSLNLTPSSSFTSAYRTKRKLVHHPSPSSPTHPSYPSSITSSPGAKKQAFIRAFPQLLLQSFQESTHDLPHDPPTDLASFSIPSTKKKSSNPYSSDNTSSKYHQKNNKMVHWTTHTKRISNIPW